MGNATLVPQYLGPANTWVETGNKSNENFLLQEDPDRVKFYTSFLEKLGG